MGTNLNLRSGALDVSVSEFTNTATAMLTSPTEIRLVAVSPSATENGFISLVFRHEDESTPGEQTVRVYLSQDQLAEILDKGSKLLDDIR